MKFIIGKKIDMTQVWQGDEAKAVTRVKAGPCPVVQIKRQDKDGYEAVQLGFGERKEKNIKKPQKNHTRGLGNLRHLREFNLSRPKKNDGLETELERGDIIGADTFAIGDIVQVTGTSKGKGFQGVIKRHGFHGHNTTHGTKDQVRHSGSISAGGVQHVFKGMRMSGRMGGDQVTVKNLRIIEVDAANGILSIEGAIPGARNSLVLIQGSGKLEIKKREEVKEIKKEDNIDNNTNEAVAPATEEKEAPAGEKAEADDKKEDKK